MAHEKHIPMNLVVFLTRGMSLSKWAQGGVIERELALYERLTQHGMRVTFISWGGPDDRTFLRNRQGMRVAHNTFSLPQNLYERFLPILHAPTFLKADMIKTNQMNGADIALKAASFWHKPLIARCGFIWSEFRNRQRLHNEEQRARTIEKDVYTHACRGIVTTEAMKKYLVKEHDIKPSKIEVIPNYVVDDFFFQHNKPDNPLPTVLAVGRLAEQKNLDSLIRACRTLPVKLRILGEGHLRPELKALADELGVTLDMPGQVHHDQLPTELSRADIYAIVSHYEGHPKTLLEAMACGIPILATKAPGIVEVVENGTSALTCTPTPDGIRAGLKVLLENKTLPVKLGAKARQRAQDLWSLDAVVRKELALYTSIMERPA